MISSKITSPSANLLDGKKKEIRITSALENKK